MPMETAREFINRTESAARHLFIAIDSYIDVLRDAPRPALVDDYASEEQALRRIEAWAEDHRDDIEQQFAAERRFFRESIALATLCGSVLGIACTALRMYSNQDEVPVELRNFVRQGGARYCVGREIRGLPLGLIVYAGRNQNAHVDDELREPSRWAFEQLATGHSYGEGIRDPAFDLIARTQWDFSSNVTSLISWRGYEQYEEDMRDMLGI